MQSCHAHVERFWKRSWYFKKKGVKISQQNVVWVWYIFFFTQHLEQFEWDTIWLNRLWLEFYLVSMANTGIYIYTYCLPSLSCWECFVWVSVRAVLRMLRTGLRPDAHTAVNETQQWFIKQWTHRQLRHARVRTKNVSSRGKQNH